MMISDQKTFCQTGHLHSFYKVNTISLKIG